MRRRIRMLSLLLLGIGVACGLNAQTANTYTFSVSSGATLDPMSGASTAIGSSVDDTPSSLLNIGFDFVYEGNTYTQFSMTPDGFVKLGSPVAVSQFTNSITSTTNIPKLFPYWDDLATGTTGNVTYVVTGSAPDRILKIQWFVTIPRNTTGPANSTMQVWLYETSGMIEFRYGAVGGNSTSASLGINGTTATNFISITTPANTASTVTANNSNTVWPGNGTMFSFAPPAPCSGMPTGGMTVASANPVCSGVNFNLSLTGASQGLGIMYQWQSSTDGVSYSDIAGATSSTLTTNSTVPTWYQCVVTCSNSGLSAASAPVMVNVTPEPVGNTFANPIVLGALPQTYNGDNLAANCWTSTYTGANAQSSPDVFFQFQITDCDDDSNVDISLCTASFDTYLHILDASGTQIANNDDNGPLCSGTRSSISLASPAVGTYYAVVEGFSTNTGTFTLAITSTDLTPPSITCPANIATSNDPGACGAAVSYSVMASDNCSATVTQNMGLASGSTFPIGMTTNSFTATDPAGMTATCSFTVTVNDTESPTFTLCPLNSSINATVGCMGVMPDLAFLAAQVGLYGINDNCPGVTLTQSIPTGAPLPLGTTPYVVTLTDAAGNTSQCFDQITVTDLMAPDLNCPAAVNVGTDAGVCAGTANFSVTATDNCDMNVDIMQTSGPASGSVFSLGSTTVSFMATDDSGNTSTCSFDVTVTDDDGPVISVCPPNVAVMTNSDCQAITEDYTALVMASDNCSPSVSVMQSPAPGTISGGFLTIVMTVSDDIGNTSTCSFQTTAGDMNPPTIDCPAAQSFNADDDCQTPIPDFTGLANATDNCGGFIVTQMPAPGTPVGFGQTLVTLTVTDGAGLTSSCVMEAYSVDVTPPVTTCPANQVLDTDPNTCTAVAMFMCPLAPDNCSGSANPEQILGLPSGSAFPLGVNVVGFQSTDASGNTSSCTFTITVVDNDPPYLSCPDDIVMDTDPGLCSAIVIWSDPTTHDNCGMPTLMQTGGLTSGSAFPKGTTVVSFQSTDAAGNSTTCSFSVTVEDNEAPMITCPGDIVTGNDLNQCGAVVTYAAPTFSDNCPGATIMQTAGLPSGAFFPVGTTTNVFQVTDASGNTATCSFTVTVNDTQNPTITCPANIVQNNDPDECGAIVTYNNPTFSDNCPGATIMLVDGLPSGSFFPVGTTTNVWKVTDAAGNMATCSFTVTVVDVQPPVFNNCPGNITQENDPGVCGAVVTWPKITASDNCPGVVVSFVSGMASGSLFNIGSTTVVYKATDASGNMATCSFIVTVIDTENPDIMCPANIQKNNDFNQCSANIAFLGTAMAMDNCGVTSITNDGIGTYPVGVTVVTWTAVDAAGNSVTCQQTVTVVDAQFPSVSCPDDIFTINDPNLPCLAPVTYTTSGADNCPGVVVETSEWPPSENGLYSLGTTMVMVTATDAAGNQVMCTFNIVVEPGAEICNGLDDDCDGYVDETDDAWKMVDKSTASNGKESDLFGASVAVFGKYAVVGAKNADLAYVLKSNELSPDQWEQVAILNPAQVDDHDFFGASVGISGDLLVVGAPQDDDLGPDAGAAYVFVKNASDNWNLVKKLTASDGFSADNFGTTVSVSGDHILVGASMNDEKGLNAGAAYLFGKDQGGANNWGQVAKITAADGQAGDMFGASMDLDGDFAVIGANLDDDKGINAGSAYVFGKDQGGANAWGMVKKLTANDGTSFDNFGVSVGINGDFLIVGANQNDDYGSNSGSAYIFERNHGGVADSWGQATKLLALDGTSSDQLGIAVSLNGNYAVAGARFDNIKGTNSGAAYIWERQTNGVWEYVAKIHDAQGDKNDQFGTVLDIYKRTIIVGSLRDDVAGKPDQGSVSFFSAGCDDNIIDDNPINGFVQGGNTTTNNTFGVKAYPQPFSDVLNIEVSVEHETNARVVIWNAFGQEVATVYSGTLEGNTTLRWDATRFASGSYFLRVEADDMTEVRPIVLVR
ncbi:MAG: HYR domain-containing protein [Lewinellaceae bacterium]|nr:HYR domain-containing protein [Lewinellaceae bacterium]